MQTSPRRALSRGTFFVLWAILFGFLLFESIPDDRPWRALDILHAFWPLGLVMIAVLIRAVSGPEDHEPFLIKVVGEAVQRKRQRNTVAKAPPGPDRIDLGTEFELGSRQPIDEAVLHYKEEITALDGSKHSRSFTIFTKLRGGFLSGLIMRILTGSGSRRIRNRD